MLAVLDAGHAERLLPVQMPAVREACLEDYRQFCWGVPPEAAASCCVSMLGSAPALSPPCREALQGHELLGPGTEGQDWDK